MAPKKKPGTDKPVKNFLYLSVWEVMTSFIRHDSGGRDGRGNQEAYISRTDQLYRRVVQYLVIREA